MTASSQTIIVNSPEEFSAHLIAFGISDCGKSSIHLDQAGHYVGTEADGRSIDLNVQYAVPLESSDASHPAIAKADVLDEIMLRAVAFSTENPPHHPGTVARFPMPSERFAGCVEVPLAVVAVEAGRAGLYAPPRVAVIDWTTAEPRGVGEFPGFSPEEWPPARLGDWPPTTVRGVDADIIAACVTRLNGCLSRLINHELGFDPHRFDTDLTDARSLIHRLDLLSMMAPYHAISPGFATTLGL